MNENPATVAFLGFPRTGKSTYLGALWQLAQDRAEPAVVERHVTGDRSYLQKLGEQVALGTELGRTEVSSGEGMQLTLGFEQGDITVDIPDLGGETLRLLVEDRVWHSRLEETIAASNAMLLFLHPEKFRLPTAIETADEILAGFESPRSASGAQPADGPDARPRTERELPQFENAAACTVAQCLDALENILWYKRTGWPIRLVIVISAWDTVDGSPTPAEWLKDRAPALDSFANANTDMVEWSLYGVSAQGGSLPADRDELLARGRVRERVYARDASGHLVSLAEPLRWVLWK